MFHIALFEPQIAPNTGNIIRLTANNGSQLHLIEPMGFNLEEKKLRRAGLDYRDLTQVTLYANYAEFLQKMAGRRIIACSTKAKNSYSDVDYRKDDVLLFGSETAGLPTSIQANILPQNQIRIPMQANSRSLNLSNAVAIISYEAWRQHNFETR